MFSFLNSPLVDSVRWSSLISGNEEGVHDTGLVQNGTSRTPPGARAAAQREGRPVQVEHTAFTSVSTRLAGWTVLSITSCYL